MEKSYQLVKVGHFGIGRTVYYTKANRVTWKVNTYSNNFYIRGGGNEDARYRIINSNEDTASTRFSVTTVQNEFARKNLIIIDE